MKILHRRLFSDGHIDAFTTIKIVIVVLWKAAPMLEEWQGME
jgi:hypothetical protein